MSAAACYLHRAEGEEDTAVITLRDRGERQESMLQVCSDEKTKREIVCGHKQFFGHFPGAFSSTTGGQANVHALAFSEAAVPTLCTQQLSCLLRRCCCCCIPSNTSSDLELLGERQRERRHTAVGMQQLLVLT